MPGSMVDPATRRGVLLHLSAAIPDGERVRGSWKAHSPLMPMVDDEGRVGLRWELRRVLPMCAFRETPKRKLWDIISDCWHGFQTIILLVGFALQVHIGRSKHALLKQASVTAAELAGAEQENWVSTAGLLCLLAAWPSRRKTIPERKCCESVGRAFFEATLPIDGVAPLVRREIPNDAARLCDVAKDRHGLCMCLRKSTAPLHRLREPHTYPSPQAFLYAKMVWLTSALPCEAARASLCDLTCRLSDLIEEGHHQWGDHSWHRGGDATVMGFSKRRRVDFHVKQFVVHDSVQLGEQASCAQAARAVVGASSCAAVKWRSSEMSSYRAATLMAFDKDSSISVTVDATRLGRPARDVLAGFVYSVGKGVGAALPPQVVELQPSWISGAWSWSSVGCRPLFSESRRMGLVLGHRVNESGTKAQPQRPLHRCPISWQIRPSSGHLWARLWWRGVLGRSAGLRCGRRGVGRWVRRTRV